MYLNEETSPFHIGEAAVQTRLGVREEIEPWARKVVRPYLPDQHREFFSNQPFLVAAARDSSDRMWSTLLLGTDGQPGFASSPTPTTLVLGEKNLARGDALAGSLREGSDLGILGIEFDAKRRNRVNGRVSRVTDKGIEFKVDQSFGNCPQYIKPRQWWSARPTRDMVSSSSHVTTASDQDPYKSTSRNLKNEQIETIKSAETIYFATGYRGEGEDPRYGCDASHRGGPPGFVRVLDDGKTLAIPDYSGNNHFNTIGNLQMDPRMGITVPRFRTGGMIQMTGTAVVDWDGNRAVAEHGPGAQRVILFTIDEIVDVPDGSLSVRWSDNGLNDESQRRVLQVIDRIQESDDVVSFVMKPQANDSPDLWPFKAGQHLPITIEVPSDNSAKTANSITMDRTYSLSCGPEWGTFRISVKREANGVASNFLHDHVRVGDTIACSKPAGDFVLGGGATGGRTRTTVLVSAGIGITPMVSMLHQFAQSVGEKPLLPGQKPLVFVHGARDGRHHPFKEEVDELVNLVGKDVVNKHVAYSSPKVEDIDHDSAGRVSDSLLKDIIGDGMDQAEFYLCGPIGFMADIRDGLERIHGVDSKLIYTEAF